MIDKAREYVYVRFKHRGVVRKQLIGRTSEPDAIDKANFQAQQLRHQRRSPIPGFDVRGESSLTMPRIFSNNWTEKSVNRRQA
jgi:hypothetical protein